MILQIKGSAPKDSGMHEQMKVGKVRMPEHTVVKGNLRKDLMHGRIKCDVGSIHAVWDNDVILNCQLVNVASDKVRCRLSPPHAR